jgi:hypothetical protein
VDADNRFELNRIIARKLSEFTSTLAGSCVEKQMDEIQARKTGSRLGPPPTAELSRLALARGEPREKDEFSHVSTIVRAGKAVKCRRCFAR